MATCHVPPPDLEAETRDFYCDMMHRLQEGKIPFLVGGTYAMERYTGIPRRTKDLDLFVRKQDFDAIVKVARQAGYRAELTSPHWLGKIFHDADFIDLIFGSGNKICNVDDGWFEHAVEETVLGVRTLLCPPEEIVWSKSFIMERERFDGADVIHLIHARADTLDWRRLLSRFDRNWMVLYSHLVMFKFVYPSEGDLIPREVFDTLTYRLASQEPVRELRGAGRLCQGTLVSRSQYLIDVDCWDYTDARMIPPVSMTPEELAIWNTVV